MDVLGVGVDVRQQPVAQNVSLDAESKFQLPILLNVHQLSLGILLSSSGAPESLDGIDQVTLAEGRRRRDLALVE
jgi:hypothetical protein